MFNAIPAHIEFVERYDILGEVVFYRGIGAKLSFYSIVRREKVRNLYIDFFAILFTDEIYLLSTGNADRHAVAAAQQLHADDVFQYLIYGRRILAANRFAQTVVGEIIFFIYRQNLFPYQILAAHTIKQKGFLAGIYVI